MSGQLGGLVSKLEDALWGKSSVAGFGSRASESFVDLAHLESDLHLFEVRIQALESGTGGGVRTAGGREFGLALKDALQTKVSTEAIGLRVQVADTALVPLDSDRAAVESRLKLLEENISTLFYRVHKE